MHRRQWIIFLPNYIQYRDFTSRLISYRIVYSILVGAGNIYIYVYMCVCVYIRIYSCACVYVYIHMPANACYYVYMIICMSFMCAHFMYADFIMFFTYGCLVRDDLIKMFKQNMNLLSTSGVLEERRIAPYRVSFDLRNIKNAFF